MLNDRRLSILEIAESPPNFPERSLNLCEI